MRRNKVLTIFYGTLKSGYGNNRLIQHPTTKFLGEIETPAKYTLYNGGFPIIERGGETSIKGELYELNDEGVIEDVFNLEGCYSQTKGSHNRFYDIDDDVPTPYGPAILFVMNKGKSGRREVIKSGIWK